MKRSLVRKLIAVLLSLTTFAVQCAFGDLSQASIWKERRDSRPLPACVQMAALPIELPGVPSRISLSRRMPALPASSARTPLARALEALPTDRVTIGEAHVSGARPPVIVIQDIHLNVEAQRNVEAAIRSLIDSGAVGSLHLEGAFGRLDLSRFRFFPAEVRSSLVGALLDRNAVGGPTAAAVLAHRSIETFGADQETAYDDNVAAIREAARLRPAAMETLNELRRGLTGEKRSIYGPALRSYDRLLDAHARGDLDFGGYVKRLVTLGLETPPEVQDFLAAQHLEETLDFTRVERERRVLLERLTRTLSSDELKALSEAATAFRDGRLNFGAFYAELEHLCRRHELSLTGFPAFRAYLRYVTIADRIDAARLLAWLDGAEPRLIDRLAKSPAERALASRDRALRLADKLIRFHLTPDEWARWKRSKPAVDPEIGQRIEPFERFYRDADVRTRALIRSVLSAPGDKPRVLVVGGFHAPALTAALREGGVPYALVSPRLTKTDASATAYLQVFTREKTPLEKIFAGEKLTINPEGTVWGGARPASRASGLNFLARAIALVSRGVRRLPPGLRARADGNVIHTDIDGTPVDVALGDAPGFAPVDPEPIGGTRIVRPNWAFTPGAWAGAWQGSVNVLARLTSEKFALKMRPLIAGTGEGAIAASFALLFPGSITAVLAWQGLTMALHYFYGVYWWNDDLNTWDIVRYVRRAEPGATTGPGEFRVGPFLVQMPDRRYWRANMVAATSTLGFFTAALGLGVTVTFLFAIVPHVIVSFTRERRIDEERRRATDEKKRQFEEAERIRRIVDSPEPPGPGELSFLLKELETRNDLAAFVRFNENGNGRYRLATIMQPGSTNGAEGPGFKNLNDSIGYNLMNVVFANRNTQTWASVRSVFSDLSDRAGRPVVQFIGSNSKVVRFAVDTDAMERLFPDPKTREAELEARMTEATRRASQALTTLLTTANRGTNSVANSEIVAAVRLAQAKGKLPKKIANVPLYWGLSTEAPRGNLDESLVRDAESTAAINAVRAEPLSTRPLGRSFTMVRLRENLLAIASLKEELTALGVLRPTERPGGAGFIAPQTLIDALRKKKDPAVLKILARQLGKDPRKDSSELRTTLATLRRYVGLLSTFDSIKPWVGTRERPEALEVAADVNASIAALEALQSSPGADARAAWTQLRARLLRALSRDPRAPFLGSQFEFYGRSVPSAPTQDMAAIFVDFRGFGALIFNELEATASRLAKVARGGDDAALHAAFSNESLILGDPSLDPFAASLRRVRAYFEDRFGADAGLRFYFGGDDVTIMLPRQLVYRQDPDRPDGDLLRGIFQQVPDGMRVRVVCTSTWPHKGRGDATLAVALALQDADELATTAKGAEETWKARSGQPVEEVVVYTDRSGAHYRAPVYDRVPGRGEIVFPGHDDNATAAVKWLMTIYKRFVNRNGDDNAARQWAEAKAEGSLILLAAGVATVELVLIPGFSVLFNNFVGPGAAIVLGALVVVLFHESTAAGSWVRRVLTRHVFRRRVPRQTPPGPWTDRWAVRVAARFIASTLILSVAFLPLYGAMAPGHLLLFESLRPFVPTLTSAWLLHTLWNIYVPPAWRLNLVASLRRGLNDPTPGESADLSAYRQFNAAPAGSQDDLLSLLNALPLKLGVSTLDRPTAFYGAASEAMWRKSRNWQERGLLDPASAREEWQRFSEKLRRIATGRNEDRLTLQSAPALTAGLAQEAADATAGDDLIVVRFIDGDGMDGVAQARKALAERGKTRLILVVKGNAATVEQEFGAAIPVVPWHDGMRMTDVQTSAAETWARIDRAHAETIVATLARASVRLLVPESFGLPADFLTGVANLDRYKVFVLIRDALLAVEIQPTRLDDIGVIGRVINDQA